MLRASAIIAPTITGSTARILSRFRSPSPIVAITPNPVVQRQLALFWGVHPLISRRASDTDTVIDEAVETARVAGLVGEGDTVVITAGRGGRVVGGTDLIKVYCLAKVLARGHGLGSQVVQGRVRRLEGPLEDLIVLHRDEIIVTQQTDRTFTSLLQRAAGLVTVEEGVESHGYMVAVEQGLPALVGVDNIDALQDGDWIVLDTAHGQVVEHQPA
ncbi:MAG: pyruvate kinase alpha/beta domain-containing protein [Anaerolineae bacterium]